jgi:predicted nucleic acid-binding protein
MYLLDTGIVFELRNARAGRIDPGLAAWTGSISAQTMFLSAISFIDLESAAARVERRDKNAAAALRNWIDNQLAKAFEGRILAIDRAVARRRRSLPFPDGRVALLAATAAEHGLTMVTRESAAFRGGRIKVFNPSGYSPDAAEDETDWREAARNGPLWLKNLFIRT